MFNSMLPLVVPISKFSAIPSEIVDNHYVLYTKSTPLFIHRLEAESGNTVVLMDNNNTQEDTAMTDTRPVPLGASLGANIERLRQRKQRRVTSCFPCRDRKVNCDKGQPCDTCKERKHPDLCSYDRVPSIGPSTPSTSHRLPQSPNNIATPPLRSLVPAPSSIGGRRDNVEIFPVSPTCVRPPFLGDNAIPSFARTQSNSLGVFTG